MSQNPLFPQGEGTEDFFTFTELSIPRKDKKNPPQKEGL